MASYPDVCLRQRPAPDQPRAHERGGEVGEGTVRPLAAEIRDDEQGKTPKDGAPLHYSDASWTRADSLERRVTATPQTGTVKT